MQKDLAFYQLTTGEWHLVLTLKYDQPKVIDTRRLKGKYSIVPKRCQIEMIRRYEIVSGSAGVGVYLWMQSSQRLLYQKDIVFCERELFRLANSQLARHGEPKNHAEIRECLRDLLGAQVFQDREHESRRRAQIRDLSQRLSSGREKPSRQDRHILQSLGNISLPPAYSSPHPAPDPHPLDKSEEAAPTS